MLRVLQIRAPLPRRMGTIDESKGVLITCTATHRQKNLFFVLVQVRRRGRHRPPPLRVC